MSTPREGVASLADACWGFTILAAPVGPGRLDIPVRPNDGETFVGQTPVPAPTNEGAERDPFAANGMGDDS